MADPLQFAFRTSKGIGVVDAAPVYTPLGNFQRPEGNLRCCVYSPCGRFFAWASPETVTIVETSIGHVVASLTASNVYELGFSPLGTYIITWQRPSKDENGDAEKNLKVWTVAQRPEEGGDEEQRLVGRFVQKSQTGWNLQYTQDEAYCTRTVTNEVHFYESGDLSKVWNKIRVEGVTEFALAPGANQAVAVFIPERKGQPAAVKIFNVPNFDTPVSQKSFFKADKVKLKWNEQGTGLIVLAQTEVDKSGKNYDGETTLYLLSANGGFDSRIDLDREGPIYDVSWSPSSKEFCVAYGFMPAKTTIFNSKAVATHSFALGPRNTVKFSPNGRFLLVAGFGNLAGDIDIYDLEKNYLKICSMKASNASVCEWSCDSRYIMTATTSPRLRVDNGVRIWHVGGGLMFCEDMQELYHVTWRPQSATSCPPGDPLHPVPAPHESALAFLGTVKTPSKPAGAYRPPGARGTTTPLAFMREDLGGAAYIRDGGPPPVYGKPRRREVPGAEPATELASGSVTIDGDENLSKAALKNKKKREAKKAKGMGMEKTGGLAPAKTVTNGSLEDSPSINITPDRRERQQHHHRSHSRNHSGSRPHSRNRSDNSIKARAAPAGAPPPQAAPNGASSSSLSQVSHPPPETPTVVSPGIATPHDKKVRALTKKLRAIDDLKMRRAGGEQLEVTQVKKMETEDAVRKELEALGWKE